MQAIKDGDLLNDKTFVKLLTVACRSNTRYNELLDWIYSGEVEKFERFEYLAAFANSDDTIDYLVNFAMSKVRQDRNSLSAQSKYLAVSC